MIKIFSEFNNSSITESKKILNHTEYDQYLLDKDFMKFFNLVKNRILELFPNHNISNIELLIDKINQCYVNKYDVDDTVDKLYMSGDLYKFTTKGLDQ